VCFLTGALFMVYNLIRTVYGPVVEPAPALAPAGA
jgi:hypothetical protein